MPNHSTLAIANEFLRRRNNISIPAQMQLQKLVYHAHGWNLAVNGLPLVSEAVEAWDNGPVYRDLWDHIRDFGFGSRSRVLENPSSGTPFVAQLSSQEEGVIASTWKKYGHFSGNDLSRMTHQPGTPWTKIYFSRGRDAAIPNADIKAYFQQLAQSGRA